ncbi:MAG: hypothetical protein PUP92_39010 [Rhizonema sp. PD38]|nr:hypothetical protein [Rhizonema sp. PD38]
MVNKIVTPIYYQIYKRSGAGWFIKEPGKVFYSPDNEPTDLQNIVLSYNTTEQTVVTEFFRINGGKSGYYLANLRDKKYYYCGDDWESVKQKLLNLGIGRIDPFEKNCG